MRTPSGHEVYAMGAEYPSPAALYEAAKMVRDAGFKRWDVFSPFPIHGMDEAMGLGKSWLSAVVLAGEEAVDGLAAVADGIGPCHGDFAFDAEVGKRGDLMDDRAGLLMAITENERGCVRPVMAISQSTGLRSRTSRRRLVDTRVQRRRCGSCGWQPAMRWLG